MLCYMFLCCLVLCLVVSCCVFVSGGAFSSSLPICVFNKRCSMWGSCDPSHSWLRASTCSAISFLYISKSKKSIQ